MKEFLPTQEAVDTAAFDAVQSPWRTWRIGLGSPTVAAVDAVVAAAAVVVGAAVVAAMVVVGAEAAGASERSDLPAHPAIEAVNSRTTSSPASRAVRSARRAWFNLSMTPSTAVVGALGELTE